MSVLVRKIVNKKMIDKTEFIRFALRVSALKFGQFQTKAGRQSPYFFNTGHFNDGQSLLMLAQYYAQTFLEYEAKHGRSFDMLFGPAYKGISLAACMALELARQGRNLPMAYNRKEAKDHGEGGLLVGAPLAGRVLIIDDVISAGTSVKESVNWIRQAGATPAGVMISVDRMEKGGDSNVLTERSAVQEVQSAFGIPVLSVIDLNDLLAFLDQQNEPELAAYRSKVAEYRTRYGAV
jgi:orotate phosphoribosyltransferase